MGYGAGTKMKTNFIELTGVEKAAIFLLMMGEEYAAAVFKKINKEEVSNILAAMSDFEMVMPDLYLDVAKEFIEKFKSKDQTIVAGDDFIHKIITKAFDKANAQHFLKQVQEGKRELPFAWTKNVNTNNLIMYLDDEHPQTVAMVLSYMPSETSAEIFMSFTNEKKKEVSLRIAKLGNISEEIIRTVDDSMKNELSEISGTGSHIKSTSVQNLVDILGGVDKSTEDLVLETVEEENKELGDEIRQLMFLFEDLLNVDDRGMREILKKVESSILTTALKTASEELQKKITSNLSSRAAEMLLEDLEVMGPIKLSEVEAAQQEVITAAKELEAEGTITLGGGKGEQLV